MRKLWRDWWNKNSIIFHLRNGKKVKVARDPKELYLDVQERFANQLKVVTGNPVLVFHRYGAGTVVVKSEIIAFEVF